MPICRKTEHYEAKYGDLLYLLADLAKKLRRDTERGINDPHSTVCHRT